MYEPISIIVRVHEAEGYGFFKHMEDLWYIWCRDIAPRLDSAAQSFTKCEYIMTCSANTSHVALYMHSRLYTLPISLNPS